MLNLIYDMFINNLYIKKIYKLILSYLILFNVLIPCSLNFSENFFNDDIIGYYLSAVDINTGESNVLLFDYALDFGGDCPLPTDIDIRFEIIVDIPVYTNGLELLAEGDFKLIPNPSLPDVRSFSFRNTDMSLDQVYLPGGATLQGGDYVFDPVEGLSSAITSGGRLPNGRYYFQFYIEDCPDEFNCNAGIDKELNRDFVLMFEYDAMLNDNKNQYDYEDLSFGKGIGYLNAGLRWAMAENLLVELNFNDITRNQKVSETAHREFKILYSKKF